MKFYTEFLTSLSNYLENKNQRGGFVLQDIPLEQTSGSHQIKPEIHRKTQKNSNQEKKRITRKRVIF